MQLTKRLFQGSNSIRITASVLVCGFTSFSGLFAQMPGHSFVWTLGPWGIGGDYHTNMSAEANARWIPQIVSIGIKSHRTANTGWETVEPTKGKWTWANLDAQMNYLTKNHIAFGGILAGNPQWDTQSPQGLPVNNLSGWSEYVSHLVNHAKGMINFWEVWNEPPNGTAPDQTAADYAKIVVSSYDAAKAADPSCAIGMATKSVDVNYLAQAIQAGAKDHFDYITLHPYETLGTVVHNLGTEAVYMAIVPTVRKMLRDLDPAKANVPIIFTEIGCDAGQEGPDVQGYALVKAFTMGISEGVACINWFEAMDGDSGPMGMFQGNGTARPSYTAMAQMIKILGENPAYLGWVLFNDKDYGFVFKGAKGAVLVTWESKKGEPDTINLGQSVSIVDPLTGTASNASTYALTTAPVLIEGVPATLVKMALANKRKPFPWGGDYSNARSVSITMGATNKEQGLHTQAASSIAADVVAYGGGSRSGSVPGGTVFMVDPNFLTYTSTPIEISIVVRCDEANDRSGFKLGYESTSGFKNLGWYTVPDNKQWYTVKYKIMDAQFVGMYAYNFSLYSDGNQYNKYDIQSVTITKVDK